MAPEAQAPGAFNEPWQAQAFAMAVTLHARGLFTWQEWADALAAEIAAAAARGEREDYYRHWLAALEKLAARKGAIVADELERRIEHLGSP